MGSKLQVSEASKLLVEVTILAVVLYTYDDYYYVAVT